MSFHQNPSLEGGLEGGLQGEAEVGAEVEVGANPPLSLQGVQHAE